MGLFSGAKSTSGSAQKWAKPFAMSAANTVQDVYGANAGNLAEITGQVSSVLPGLLERFNTGDSGVDAAGGYVTDVLGGKYMGGNPFLEAMIGRTSEDVRNRVNANFGSRGSFGGTAHTTALTKALADAELGLRYGNYSDEMGRMGSAAGMAPSLAQAQYTGLPEILQTSGVAAELPYAGINALSGNLGNLFSGGVQKGQGFLAGVLGEAAKGAGAALAASDRRLKTKVKLLRRDPDGLGWYEFAYKTSPDVLHVGVMADEVKELRPQAYIPNFTSDGYDGVNYAALGEAA